MANLNLDLCLDHAVEMHDNIPEVNWVHANFLLGRIYIYVKKVCCGSWSSYFLGVKCEARVHTGLDHGIQITLALGHIGRA